MPQEITCTSLIPPAGLGPVEFDNSEAIFTHDVSVRSDLYVGNKVNTCSLSAIGTINTDTIEANNVISDDITADTANITDLTSTNFEFVSGNIEYANIQNLSAVNINLSPESVNINNLDKSISPSLTISVPETLVPLQTGMTIRVINPYDYEMEVEKINIVRNSSQTPVSISIESFEPLNDDSYNATAIFSGNFTASNFQRTVFTPTGFIIKPYGIIRVILLSSSLTWFSVSLSTKRV